MFVDSSGGERDDSCLKQYSPAKQFSWMNGKNVRPDLSIIDLRARRVFSPDVKWIMDEENTVNVNIGKRKLHCLGSNSGSDPTSITGLGDFKMNENEHCDDVMVSEVKKVKQGNSGNEQNSKIEATHVDDSISKSKLDIKLSSRKKVFKSPGSFSYRRLLPYLMDMMNRDSNVSKMDLVDAGIPLKSIEIKQMKSNPKLHSSNSFSAKVENSASNSEKTKSSVMEKIISLQSRLSVQPENSNKEATFDANLLKLDQKSPDNVGVGNEIHAYVAMTPPDPDNLAHSKILHFKEDVESKSPFAGDQICKDLQVDCEKSTNISPISPVPKPCSRLRVFSNPKSVSYRKLFPFLMEISNHNSSSTTGRQQKLIESGEKSHPLSASSSEEHNRSKRIKTEDLDQKPSGVSSGSNITNPSSVTLCPEPLDDAISPAMIHEFYTEETSQSEHSPKMVEKDCSVLNINGFGQNADISAAVTSSSTNLREPELVSKSDNCLDARLEDVHLNQGVLKIELLDSFPSLINRPPKSILKTTNPRGCRGPCDCLNCASFRLHAERAYEFSRHQMQDAEEVASELIEELAKIRTLLERSINNDNKSPSIPLSLVKQVCNEAFEAEKLAKDRLCRMNYELNVHCRIPALIQPKVTFSNCVQEKSHEEDMQKL